MVLDVEILETQGAGFDEAAVLAACASGSRQPWMLREPHVLVVGYNMVFEVVAAPVVLVEGIVLEAGIRAPLVDSN